ncbi:MAG: hypothetical protein R2764_21615 [Bacteroidales bacterium]
MYNYTFIKHPIEKLHEIVPDILPGIEKIITIHYDETLKLIRGLVSEKQAKKYLKQQLNINSILPTLQRFMEEKNPIDWYGKNTLPFEVDAKTQNKAINIFSELNNIVLLIRIPDSLNKFNDLVFLYLNENPSNFGVVNSINPLTTDNKSIIGFVMYNTIKTFVNIQKQDKKTLEQFSSRTNAVIGQTEIQKYELQRTKENYGLSLVKLFQQYISEISKVNSRNYRLSASAIDKIKNYKGDLKNLESIAQNTIWYVDSLSIGQSNIVDILEWHIHFSGDEKDTTVIPSDQQDDKYAKTRRLLDRLENAALTLKSQQLKMTGTNMGKACAVPISAPAISDALYNHKSKINNLLSMYPDKWSTIRNEFRPVKNIMNNRNEDG